MTNTACLYTIVRFCPFIETEEFANVGIVMVAPEVGYLGFKLMTRKHARVTGFFEQLDSAVFRVVIANVKEELERAAKVVEAGSLHRTPEAKVQFARRLFLELTRRRETVIKFGDLRGVLTDNPRAKLEELYGHYVERDFVTKEYRETVLERVMRKWLFSAGIGDRFEKLEVGNEDYHATFPFVEQVVTETKTALKPLNLAQEQPSKILEHGGQWLFRIQTLKRKGLLPKLVVFPVEGPTEDGPRKKAYTEITGELKSAGATVVDYADKAAILQQISAS